MENNKEVKIEILLAFTKLKEELGFKITYEELDKEFFLTDYILEEDHLKENFSLQLSSKIISYFRNWSDYLNGLMVPNPGYYPNQTESKLFSNETDRKKIWEHIKKCMKYSSMYSLMYMNKDLKLQKQFFDETHKVWTQDMRPYMTEVLTKVHDGWTKE